MKNNARFHKFVKCEKILETVILIKHHHSVEVGKGLKFMGFKLTENGMIPIYENEKKEKRVNARELHTKLESKQEFANWIKNRIKKYEFLENQDYFRFDKFIKADKKGYGNKKMTDYRLTIDMAKELAMIEHNQIGRKIRKYFIEVEKRYLITNMQPLVAQL